jgi:hypothetical protein
MNTADKARGEDCTDCDVRSADADADATPLSAWVAAVLADLREIVPAVMERFVPQIDGLPSGEELDSLVKNHCYLVYLTALGDPDLHSTHSAEWRKTIAARVGLALAFPANAPHALIADARYR